MADLCRSSPAVRCADDHDAVGAVHGGAAVHEREQRGHHAPLQLVAVLVALRAERVDLVDEASSGPSFPSDSPTYMLMISGPMVRQKDEEVSARRFGRSSVIVLPGAANERSATG